MHVSLLIDGFVRQITAVAARRRAGLALGLNLEEAATLHARQGTLSRACGVCTSECDEDADCREDDATCQLSKGSVYAADGSGDATLRIFVGNGGSPKDAESACEMQADPLDALDSCFPVTTEVVATVPAPKRAVTVRRSRALGSLRG